MDYRHLYELVNMDGPTVAKRHHLTPSDLLAATPAAAGETYSSSRDMSKRLQPALLRRTRFVCVSDTHNYTVKLPKGDVLIHAGDITNQGSLLELSKSVRWIEEADFEAKIIIAGNHDITLDESFYNEHGHQFHNQSPQSPESCLSLLTSSSSITYLNHTSTEIRLSSPSGPHTAFKVFGSPFSPRHGLWAFGYDTPQHPTTCSKLPTLWDDIPLDTDIVVTHTPPRTHRDEQVEKRHSAGCEALRRALWRVRPRLAVCGHIHDGRGADRVTWDLGSKNVTFAELSTVSWDDPGAGNSKVSLVDLTGRKAPTLANDGGGGGSMYTSSAVAAPNSKRRPTLTCTNMAGPGLGADAEVCCSTIGLGGDPGSPRCDLEALSGRMGRMETCIVNAAMMKSRYPHVGGKKYNKPIVVDLNLPVWT